MGREAVSLAEAAIILDVSRWTIYRLVKDGKLEVFTVGRCRRISLAQLQKLKRQNTMRVAGGSTT